VVSRRVLWHPRSYKNYDEGSTARPNLESPMFNWDQGEGIGDWDVSPIREGE